MCAEKHFFLPIPYYGLIPHFMISHRFCDQYNKPYFSYLQDQTHIIRNLWNVSATRSYLLQHIIIEQPTRFRERQTTTTTSRDTRKLRNSFIGLAGDKTSTKRSVKKQINKSHGQMKSTSQY